jgi:hypothetical protein
MPVPALDDHALHLALGTAADTAALLRFAVPLALDSLRQAEPNRHRVQLSLPQVPISDTAWVATLIDGRWVRGVCRPIRRQCRGNTALQVTLEATPQADANEVRLVLRDGPFRPLPRAVAMDDEMRRWLEERAVGIPNTGPLLYGRMHIDPLVLPWYLTLTPTPAGWRVTGWGRLYVGSRGA